MSLSVSENRRNRVSALMRLLNYVDMVKAGIVDPVKVARYAQGSGIASLLLVTEADDACQEEPPMPPYPGGMDY